MGENTIAQNFKNHNFWFSPLFLISFTVFVDAIGVGMIFPLLAFYAKTFQTGAFEIGLLVSSLPLMNFLFSPILGRLSDSVGRKKILLISILTSTASDNARYSLDRCGTNTSLNIPSNRITSLCSSSNIANRNISIGSV